MGLGTTAYDAGQPDGAMGYAWLKQAMIGDWTGERTDPWGPPATVNTSTSKLRVSTLPNASVRILARSGSTFGHDPSFDFTPTWLGNYGPVHFEPMRQ